MRTLLSIVVVASASLASEAATISVSVQNKCDSPVAYKVETKGSTLNTQLTQRTSRSHTVAVGDRIKVGSTVVHTVAASSNGKTVLICKK